DLYLLHVAHSRLDAGRERNRAIRSRSVDGQRCLSSHRRVSFCAAGPPMKILNRYILSKFLKPFIASFAALCLLIFVSQLFDRLDRFLADGVSIRYVIGFLVTSIPYQALQVLPVACLLATLFVVGNLSRTREYIAGLAGGLAPEKFLS